MDPNACLERIRLHLVGLWLESPSPPWSEVEDLLNHIEALDEWISNGGFLPIDWAMQTGRTS